MQGTTSYFAMDSKTRRDELPPHQVAGAFFGWLNKDRVSVIS
jgi:hypothetical protein